MKVNKKIKGRDDQNVALEDSRVVKALRSGSLRIITYVLNTFAPFLTRELRACARASCRYDVGNGTPSLARSIGRFL